MIKTSQAFREAIVGSPRRIELLAVVDISDPDKHMLPSVVSSEAAWSKKAELNDYDLSAPPRYATLERNRWLLDGSFDLFPDDYQVKKKIGYASQAMGGEDGTLAQPVTVQMSFSGVRILQAFSLYFSTDQADGTPADFAVEVWCNSQLVFTEAVAGNTAAEVQFKGFR